VIETKRSDANYRASWFTVILVMSALGYWIARSFGRAMTSVGMMRVRQEVETLLRILRQLKRPGLIEDPAVSVVAIVIRLNRITTLCLPYFAPPVTPWQPSVCAPDGL
jgi:hypothetical protein